MQEVLKAIRERSSTRGYTQEKLTKEELDAVLTAGLQAPTAANRQEIHFTVLDGGDPILAEIDAALTGGSAKKEHNFYYEAPTVVILSGNESFRWSAVDAGIAVENMALAAEALGLGSLIIGCVRDTLTGERRPHFDAALRLPEGYVFEVAIALGHKAVTKAPHEYSAEKNVTIL